MRKSIKDALEQLHALGCKLDHADRELRTDRWRFTHPNTPDEVFTVNYQSSDVGLRTTIQRAKVAAGLATSDSMEKREPKQNYRVKMEREAMRKRRETAHALAEAERAKERTRQIEAQATRNHQELDRLIRGPVVASTPTADGISAKAMLTVEEVADATGMTDKAVRRAIDSGRLEPYQCGNRVKVKGADVRDWLSASRGAA